jgi:MFS family permease
VPTVKLPRFVLPPVPPTRTDVRIVALTSLMGFFQGYALAQAANTVPFVRQSLGETAAHMSVLLAIARVGSLAAVGLTLVGDRRGRRRILLGSYAGMLVASAATALAHTAASYTMWQALTRMTGSAVGVMALVMLAETLQPGLRAYGMAFFGGAASFGAGCALVAIPINDFGPEMWRVLYAATALGFVALPAFVGRVRESPLFTPGITGTSVWTPLHGATSRSFWLVAMVSFLAAAFSAVGASFATERLVDNLGLSTTMAVAVLIVGGTVGGIGFFAGGRLADTWGRRSTLAVALVSAAIGGIGLYRLTDLWMLTVAASVSGFGAFATVPALGALRNEVFPTGMRATAVTWLNSMGVAGAAAGLGSGGYLIARLGLPGTVTLLAVGMFVAALLLIAVPETRGTVLVAGEPHLGPEQPRLGLE